MGVLSVKDGTGNTCEVDAGQCCLVTAPAGTTLEWSNPYEAEEDLINFLQVWFKRGNRDVSSCKPGAERCSFDPDTNKDRFDRIISPQLSEKRFTLFCHFERSHSELQMVRPGGVVRNLSI